MYYGTTYDSPLGELTIASDGDSLTGLWIQGQQYFLSTVQESMEERENLPVFQNTKQWLDAYFQGKKPTITELPLAPKGSAFRQEVWKILCKIPYGEVTTYGAIAKEMAKIQGKEQMSAQAIGGAVGHNPISIIIPCHRVIGSNGSLTGYAGGIDKKIHLLEIEGVEVSAYTRPK